MYIPEICDSKFVFTFNQANAFNFKFMLYRSEMSSDNLFFLSNKLIAPRIINR